MSETIVTDQVILSCGACDGLIVTSTATWEVADIVPCPEPDCDGGADLIHARRHADDQ